MSEGTAKDEQRDRGREETGRHSPSPPRTKSLSSCLEASQPQLLDFLWIFIVFFCCCCCSWQIHRRVGQDNRPFAPTHCSLCVYIFNRGVVMIIGELFFSFSFSHFFLCMYCIIVIFIILLLLLMKLVWSIFKIRFLFLLFSKGTWLRWRKNMCTHKSEIIRCGTLPPAGESLSIMVLIGPFQKSFSKVFATFLKR